MKRRVVIVTLFCAVAALLSGCSRPRATTPAVSAPTSRGEFSVYDVGGQWRDQTNAARSLASLRGTPAVIALMYTHCGSSCPLALAAMKRIERESPGVRFVLVSLDPDRDTAGALSMYAGEHGLSSERWTLVNGSDADVRALAAVLGIRYRRISPSEVAHSNALTLLDADGTIVRQQAGLDGTTEMIGAARALLAEAHIADR